MNPPLRTEADRQALLEGLRDGTIDCIATDHAPHTVDDKKVEYDQAAFGVVGLETAVSPLPRPPGGRRDLLDLAQLVVAALHPPRPRPGPARRARSRPARRPTSPSWTWSGA